MNFYYSIMQFDLHVHTTFSSCSCLPLEQLIHRAREQGLDGIVVTDHDTMEAGTAIREGLLPNGLVVIIGMEYTTPQGDFLIYGPFENIPAGLAAWELLSLVSDRGGVAIAAHPMRTTRPVQPEILKQGLCPIIESYNGRNTTEENLKASRFAQDHGLLETGSSDAHSEEEIGNVTTTFHETIATRDDLVRLLREGSFELGPGCLAGETYQKPLTA